MEKQFTTKEWRVYLRYHLGLAKLAVAAYPHKHDPFLALNSLHMDVFQAFFMTKNERWIPHHVADATNVMNNGYAPGIYRRTVNTWQRLRELFIERSNLFIKYKVASAEEIEDLRNKMRFTG